MEPEPEPPGAAWSRLFLPGAGAGADPSRSEPESAPGPWRPGAGAAQKSGSSATLHFCILLYTVEKRSAISPLFLKKGRVPGTSPLY